MEFGCIGTGGVENNDRPSECSIQLINVNELNKKVHAGVNMIYHFLLVVWHQKLVYLPGI